MLYCDLHERLPLTRVDRVRHKICKLCKKRPSRFARSHAIPRSFFHEFRGPDPHSILFNVSGKDKLTRTVQAGVWDDEILCHSCEARFSNLDHYGWKVLGKLDLTLPYLDHNVQLVGYTIKCDTDKLRRFILSVFWRASVSKIGFYNQVHLGVHEMRVINRIFDTTPLSPVEYLTSVFKLAEDFLEKYTNIIFPPQSNKLKGGGLMCILYLPGLKIVTSVGDSSALWQPDVFLIHKPNQFLVPFLPKELAIPEFNYLREVKRKQRAISGHLART